MEVTPLADGCLRVCLQQDGFESCCVVPPSYHLVWGARDPNDPLPETSERANLRHVVRIRPDRHRPGVSA